MGSNTNGFVNANFGHMPCLGCMGMHRRLHDPERDRLIDEHVARGMKDDDYELEQAVVTTNIDNSMKASNSLSECVPKNVDSLRHRLAGNAPHFVPQLKRRRAKRSCFTIMTTAAASASLLILLCTHQLSVTQAVARGAMRGQQVDQYDRGYEDDYYSDEHDDNNKDSNEECWLNAYGDWTCDDSKQRRGSSRYPQECFDVRYDCAELAQHDGCIWDFDMMRDECRRTCLLCDNVGPSAKSIANIYSDEPQELQQAINSEPEAMQLWDALHDMDEYMYEVVYAEEALEEVRMTCKNKDKLCLFWSTLGECESNPAYMEIHCAPACHTCERISFEKRCPFDRNEPKIWETGDLHRMFQRIVMDPQWAPHNPQILSQPRNTTASDNGQEDAVEMADEQPLEGPWVIILDDFLTEEECETLIQLGAARGYERSEDASDEINFDGTFDGVVSEERTSMNAWCEEECFNHSTTQQVLKRMEQLTEIPEIQYEHLQLLRYEVGQFYGVHHDFIETQVDRAPGPRILTVFLYLNDVEAGGGTRFPSLDNLTVQPKRGRVLLWPSVLDEAPMKIDERAEHEALPVEKGVKYGANAWVHQRDWKTPLSKNCH